MREGLAHDARPGFENRIDAEAVRIPALRQRRGEGVIRAWVAEKSGSSFVSYTCRRHRLQQNRTTAD